MDPRLYCARTQPSASAQLDRLTRLRARGCNPRMKQLVAAASLVAVALSGALFAAEKPYAFTASSLEELPACFSSGETSYTRMMEAAARRGTSWRSFNPAAKVVKSTPTTLSVSEIGMDHSLELKGQSGGKITVLHTWSYPGGSGRGAETWTFVRKAGEKVMRVESGEHPCRSTMDAWPSACNGDAADAARASFKKLYDKKEYAKAFDELDGFLEGCAEEGLHDLPLARVLSDLAITAHHQKDDNKCLELLSATRGLGGLVYDDRLVAAIEANRGICAASIDCSAAGATSVRNAAKKLASPMNQRKLETYHYGCGEKTPAVSMGWVLSDAAYYSMGSGDHATCIALLAKTPAAALTDARLKKAWDANSGSCGAPAHSMTSQNCTYLSEVRDRLLHRVDKVDVEMFRKECESTKAGKTVEKWRFQCAERATDAYAQDACFDRPNPLAALAASIPAASVSSMKLAWVGHCEGDAATAKIVSRKEASGATAPFCVRLENDAWDPKEMNGAETPVPKWDSMTSVLLLVDTPAVEPVTVTSNRSWVNSCGCDPDCKEDKKKKTGSSTRTVTPQGGRAVFDLGATVSSWDLSTMTFAIEAAQGGTTTKDSVTLSGWALCM